MGDLRLRRQAGDQRSQCASERPNLLSGEQLPAPPCQERSRRARELLLAAALSRFAARGYEATTVDEITKQAGVAVGAFYLHFRSKRQALLILMDRLLAELDIHMTTPPDGARTVVERIRMGLEIEWSHAGAYRAWREAALHDASMEALQEKIESWTTSRIAAALDAEAAAPHTHLRIGIAALSWILSVVFWRSLEAPVEPGVADAVIALTKHALVEDPIARSNAPCAPPAAS